MAVGPAPVEEATTPQRLDALPWSRWHTRLVVALGITWLLDGLEGSLGGSLAGALKSHEGLSLTDAQLGLSSSVYLAGAVLGSIVLGVLADRFGRRKLFFWTLLGYLAATAATGAARSLTSFTICRFLTGAGIGGEYAAVNSAIDELIPARLRGRVDIAINGTFWLGIVIGSAVTVVFLSGRFFPMALGWRLAVLPIADRVCVPAPSEHNRRPSRRADCARSNAHRPRRSGGSNSP